MPSFPGDLEFVLRSDGFIDWHIFRDRGPARSRKPAAQLAYWLQVVPYTAESVEVKWTGPLTLSINGREFPCPPTSKRASGSAPSRVLPTPPVPCPARPDPHPRLHRPTPVFRSS